MSIQIDRNPYAVLKSFAGIYSKKVEYGFTIVIQVYTESDIKYVQEIIWDDKKPKNYRQVDKQIEDYWKTLN